MALFCYSQKYVSDVECDSMWPAILLCKVKYIKKAYSVYNRYSLSAKRSIIRRAPFIFNFRMLRNFSGGHCTTLSLELSFLHGTADSELETTDPIAAFSFKRDPRKFRPQYRVLDRLHGRPVGYHRYFYRPRKIQTRARDVNCMSIPRLGVAAANHWFERKQKPKTLFAVFWPSHSKNLILYSLRMPEKGRKLFLIPATAHLPLPQSISK